MELLCLDSSNIVGKIKIKTKRDKDLSSAIRILKRRNVTNATKSSVKNFIITYNFAENEKFLIRIYKGRRLKNCPVENHV